MALTVLSVGFALAPVGPDAVGGSEQVLSALDAALVAGGHRSIVVGCRGSVAAGELVETGIDPSGTVCDPLRRTAEAATRDAIAATLRRVRVDLVHMHGLDFPATVDASDAPTLVTLHLPPAWYTALPRRARTWMHCVSATQERACPPGTALLPFIGNGVPVGRLQQTRYGKRDYVLALGRVCPEKGQHIALEAAHRADVTLLLGGAVFPYPDHEAYFQDQVVPRLDARRRFVGPLCFDRKRRLLSGARCVLLPCLAPETSSLVAMEALACGTPVIAYPSGALAEIVEHGRTGFLVHDPAEMAARIAEIGSIDPELCRATARARFSVDRMIGSYLDRYHAITAMARVAA